jgi:tRNA modification GTPase
VELVDTAGLREDPDRVEAEGIRRAREALASADAILWIRDANDDDRELPEDLPTDVPVTVVHNKVDLSGDRVGYRDDEVWLSAATGAGVDALRNGIRNLAGYEGEGTFTARQRHVQALEEAAGHFVTGRKALETHRAGELLAEELRLAQQALGAITGEVSADDLLGRIFSEFCIGK